MLISEPQEKVVSHRRKWEGAVSSTGETPVSKARMDLELEPCMKISSASYSHKKL